MVRTELPVAKFGVITLGAKLQVSSSGTFEHENQTGASNEPVSEVTAMSSFAGFPGTIVVTGGDNFRNNLVVLTFLEVQCGL